MRLIILYWFYYYQRYNSSSLHRVLSSCSVALGNAQRVTNAMEKSQFLCSRNRIFIVFLFTTQCFKITSNILRIHMWVKQGLFIFDYDENKVGKIFLLAGKKFPLGIFWYISRRYFFLGFLPSGKKKYSRQFYYQFFPAGKNTGITRIQILFQD